MLSRLPRNAPAWLDRLSAWLDLLEVCFTHVAQRGAFRRYLLGLLRDSRRKSMSALLERIHDPSTYQSLQHFITDAPWTTGSVWRRPRAVIPDRTGVLILDGTSFPKQGPYSVGVARQYCGALGKIANCQVAVTAALWTSVRASRVGARCIYPRRGSRQINVDAGRLPRRFASRKVAVGPNTAAASPRQWADGDGGRGRRRSLGTMPRCGARCIAHSCRMRSACPRR